MDIVRHQPNQGWIEVVVGSMFSGKSEELIRRLRRAQIARQKVQIFKPVLDDRYGDDHIVSHSEMRIRSESVKSSRELLDRVDPDTEVVGIDEGQFFDMELPIICNTLADMGKRVIVAGLDQDYLGKPFEPMPQLLAIAEYITKTLAICMVCGDPANHTQRLVASDDRVLLGAQGMYEARCRRCFDPLLAGPPAPANSKAQFSTGNAPAGTDSEVAGNSRVATQTRPRASSRAKSS
jgi:thymidine kinase